MNVSKMISMYRQGYSLACISKEVKTTEYHVKRTLKEADVYVPKKRPTKKVKELAIRDRFDAAEWRELYPILKACHFAGYRAVR